MKIEIVLSVAITAFLGTLLVWLSIILVDIDHWYSSAADIGGAISNLQVNRGLHNPASTTGGAI